MSKRTQISISLAFYQNASNARNISKGENNLCSALYRYWFLEERIAVVLDITNENGNTAPSSTHVTVQDGNWKYVLMKGYKCYALVYCAPGTWKITAYDTSHSANIRFTTASIDFSSIRIESIYKEKGLIAYIGLNQSDFYTSDQLSLQARDPPI